MGRTLNCLHGGTSAGRRIVIRRLPSIVSKSRSSFRRVPRSILVRFVGRLPSKCEAIFGLCMLRRGKRGRVTRVLKVARRASSSRLCETGALLVGGVGSCEGEV